jgi:hypothetical protein
MLLLQLEVLVLLLEGRSKFSYDLQVCNMIMLVLLASVVAVASAGGAVSCDPASDFCKPPHNCKQCCNMTVADLGPATCAGCWT